MDSFLRSKNDFKTLLQIHVTKRTAERKSHAGQFRLTEAISYIVCNFKTKEHSNKQFNYILELWVTKFAIWTRLFSCFRGLTLNRSLVLEKIHDKLIMSAKLKYMRSYSVWTESTILHLKLYSRSALIDISEKSSGRIVCYLRYGFSRWLFFNFGLKNLRSSIPDLTTCCWYHLQRLFSFYVFNTI